MLNRYYEPEYTVNILEIKKSLKLDYKKNELGIIKKIRGKLYILIKINRYFSDNFVTITFERLKQYKLRIKAPVEKHVMLPNCRCVY